MQNDDTSWMLSTFPPFCLSSYSAWVQIMAWLTGNFLRLMIHPYFEQAVSLNNTLHFGFILTQTICTFDTVNNFVSPFNNTYCRICSSTNIQFHHIFLCSRCVSECEFCIKSVSLMNYLFPTTTIAATTTTTTTSIITTISSCFSQFYKV